MVSFFVFVFFKRTRPAASMRPPCLIYFSTSKRDGKKNGMEEKEETCLVMMPFFAFKAKMPLHTGVRRVPLFI